MPIKDKLVDDRRRVLALSLSFWMQVAGLLVLILPEAWFAATGRDYSPYVAWWAGVLLLLAGLGGRLYQQTGSVLREWLRIIAVAAIALLLALLLGTQVRAAPATQGEVVAVAEPFVSREEGLRLTAYRDVVGVWTICNGRTQGVHMGMTATAAQCAAWLRADLAVYWQLLRPFFSARAIANWLPPTRGASYLSTAYNCGPVRIGRSTATRRLNVGNIRGGCDALTWWNRAGGRVIRGLVARRAREQALCMVGLQ